MNRLNLSGAQLGLAAGAIAILSVGAGYGIARIGGDRPHQEDAAQSGRKVLYWYDPMVPSQHFDKPGKSPFMDMQLVPKYADEAQGASGVRIDPARSQGLGMRTATAQRGTLSSGLTAPGTIDFNQRDVAVVQARAAGFVQRVYGRAPGDVIGAGAPLADLLIPEWAGAQTEYLAVRRTGDAALSNAARQRLSLLGMPPGTIAAVERSGRPRNTVTISSPTGGMIKTLGVRAGMSIGAGQSLAEINGLGTVWLNAAIPEAMAGKVRIGQGANASFPAFPDDRFAGRVTAILPDVQPESRTLTARIELPNRGGRLRPGMFGNVAFGGESRYALLIPSEAVIRTGKRTLVMLALSDGRYQPAEVRVGGETGGRTEIIAGLSEGEKVVASGQFLLDSEASLSGVQARPIRATSKALVAQPAGYEATGSIEKIAPNGVTLNHGPVPALKWPSMTMIFRLGSPALTRGFKVGDRVRFTFDQPPEGPTLRRMSREGAR